MGPKGPLKFVLICNAALRVHGSYGDMSTVHAVAAAYPQSILNGTPTCSSHSDTASYETYVAGQEESGCVVETI